MADLERLREFLLEKNMRAAERASATLAAAIDSLLQFPERGRVSPLPSHRELIVPFGKSAYVVRYKYRPEDETVSIVRVWHGREDQG